jgi:NADH dehydrogenase
MHIRNVCIVGGSGFVGRSVADHLATEGIGVRVITRSRPRAMEITVLPTAELCVADPQDTFALARAFEGMDAVVNLVGILNQTRRQTFQACHVELPEKVVAACQSAGVAHLVHMSSLGASQSGPSAYQRSKGEGEMRMKRAAGALPLTIFRPSVIFGESDSFLNLFAKLLRLMPVFPLACAHARFQPIWVEDVARCIAMALGDARHFGRTYELGGPEVLTLEELVQFVARTLGLERTVIALPGWAGMLQASVAQLLPGKPLTPDNLRSMSVDNVCTQPFPESFGFKPAPLEAVVPAYLANATSRGRYARFRHYAGR